MDCITQTPIAERIRGASNFKGQIPGAMRLCIIDFLRTIGEMTGQEDRYQSIYKRQLAPYEKEGSESARIFQLLVDAESLDDAARQSLLYWVLIEPFITLNTSFYRKETIQ